MCANFGFGALGFGQSDRYGALHLNDGLKTNMADHVVPHFHNEPGVPMIEIGAREFMCEGAKPPFDHPHVYLDMGDDDEIICPYCSTLFRHDPALDPHAARPPTCAVTEPV